MYINVVLIKIMKERVGFSLPTCPEKSGIVHNHLNKRFVKQEKFEGS